jgi:hypothetical protein
MALPTPNKGETKEEFMSRCMDATMKSGEFDGEDQCSAVCMNKWQDGNDMEDDMDDDDASKHKEDSEDKKKEKKEKNHK